MSVSTLNMLLLPVLGAIQLVAPAEHGDASGEEGERQAIAGGLLLQDQIAALVPAKLVASAPATA
ncbi:MAG: hypothetical protein QM796_11505 [Chthoniobacteraceae bacterium]